MLELATSARKLKITAVLDAAPFVKLGVPPDNAPPRTNLVVTVGDRTLHADLATKSVRKAVRTLLEHGEQNITLIIQGSLAADGAVGIARCEAAVGQHCQRQHQVAVPLQARCLGGREGNDPLDGQGRVAACLKYNSSPGSEP